MACENFVKEFQSDKLGLNHDNPSDFVRSQWPVKQKIYAAYRAVISIGMIAWFLADLFYESQSFYKDRMWFYAIYATNWSFFLLVLTSVYQAVCTVVYSLRSSNNLDNRYLDKMSTPLKVQWVLQNLSYNSAIIVTFSYWSFIAFLDRNEVLQTNMSRLKHVLNTVYVLVDVMITSSPYRLLHLFYTVMLGSIYSIFNAMYFLNDGTILEGRHYAYNVLNWVNPAEAIITCILCVVLSIFSQTILYLTYRLRVGIFFRLYFSNANVKLDDDDDCNSELSSIMTDQTRYTPNLQ